MSTYYKVKHNLKLIRWRIRRLAAAHRWGPANLEKVPALVGNAMPKSGSHLIIQVLQGLTQVGPFVNPGFPPLNRFEDNSILTEADILANIQRMRPGDIAYGYIHSREPFISALTSQGRAMVFVYRDPRDMVVSHVFYATEIHTGHGMHRYYTEVLHSMSERIQAAIQGVTEPSNYLPGVYARYQNYMGWLEQPDVLCLRFENLILKRELALGKLLDYLAKRGLILKIPTEQSIEALKKAIIPRKSGTFRKGQPGNWREHFTQENKDLFKKLAGDLLIQLGYEQNDNW
jgi:sulfotransferase 6B1